LRATAASHSSANAATAPPKSGRTRIITWRSPESFTANRVLTAPANPTQSPARNTAGRPDLGRPHRNVHRRLQLGRATDGGARLVRLSAELPRQRQPQPPLGRRQRLRTSRAHRRDVLDGVEAVLKLNVIDEKRIGVYGWSEGGLLTS
jgi:hypothetical protein